MEYSLNGISIFLSEPVHVIEHRVVVSGGTYRHGNPLLWGGGVYSAESK